MRATLSSPTQASHPFGAFALALAESKDEIAAMRFAAAAAGLKCTRLGGSAGAPHRAEVEALLATPYPATASNP